MATAFVNTAEFSRELEWTARFREKKNTIPIIKQVLLSKQGGHLKFTATDLEIGGMSEIPADGDDLESMTVPVDRLLKYLKLVTEPRLALVVEVTEHQVPVRRDYTKPEPAEPEMETVKHFHLCVLHGSDGCLRLDGIGSEGYPELPAPSGNPIAISGLSFAIPRAVICISTETSRFSLCGALLDLTPVAARMVSTDGHRLSEVVLKAEGVEESVKVIVPQRALLEVVRLTDSTSVCFDDNHIFFHLGSSRRILARKLTGSFPDWERAIPQDENLKFRLTLPTALVKAALKRTMQFADERSRCVEIAFGQKMAISAGVHEASVKSSVPLQDAVEPWISGFNGEYISQFLNLAGPQFEFRYAELQEGKDGQKVHSSAVKLLQPGWTYVVMPMRDIVPASDMEVPEIPADPNPIRIPAPVQDSVKRPIPIRPAAVAVGKVPRARAAAIRVPTSSASNRAKLAWITIRGDRAQRKLDAGISLTDSELQYIADLAEWKTGKLPAAYSQYAPAYAAPAANEVQAAEPQQIQPAIAAIAEPPQQSSDSVEQAASKPANRRKRPIARKAKPVANSKRARRAS